MAQKTTPAAEKPAKKAPPKKAAAKPPKKAPANGKTKNGKAKSKKKPEEKPPELKLHVGENDLLVAYEVKLITADGDIIKRKSSVLLEGLMLVAGSNRLKVQSKVEGVINVQIRDSIMDELEVILGGPELHGHPASENDTVMLTANTVNVEEEEPEPEPAITPEQG